MVDNFSITIMEPKSEATPGLARYGELLVRKEFRQEVTACPKPRHPCAFISALLPSHPPLCCRAVLCAIVL